MDSGGLDVTSRQRWAGRIISAIPILFLLVDGAMKLFKPSFVVKATTGLGYPESTIVGIGVVLLGSVLLHLVSRTSCLGALLLTAYLGGAVASKVRVGAPVFDIAGGRCTLVGWLLVAQPEREGTVANRAQIDGAREFTSHLRSDSCRFRHIWTIFKPRPA